MAKPKCSYCQKKVAKRYCPSLDKLICPVCCGTNRLKNISCKEDCRYLDHEEYQQETRRQKELNAKLAEVPHSQHDDVFKNERAASIAYQFESFFADCHIKGDFDLRDQKVKNALTNLYYLKFEDDPIKPDDFMAVLIELYDQISSEYDSQDLIGKVILRMIISIKNMTGGQFGAHGYLNYLKNNIHPSSLNGTNEPIIEFKDGRMMELDELRKDLKNQGH
jgi:hypothetical protein